MSAFQTVFAFFAVISMILGVIFIFIDGMLLHSIAFFVIGMMIILTKIIWEIAGWADNVTRKMGED
jgi:hypothetical protein